MSISSSSSSVADAPFCKFCYLNSMKKLLLLTTLFSALACSKDEESNKTFLDKYNGTSWRLETEKMYSGNMRVIKEIFTFSNGEYFYNYYNSDNIELIEWDGLGLEIINCVQYREGVIEYQTPDAYEAEIEANEPNKFVFIINFRGELLYRIEFVPEGDNLTMSESTIEGYFLDDFTTTHILTKSDQSYSDFCN